MESKDSTLIVRDYASPSHTRPGAQGLEFKRMGINIWEDDHLRITWDIQKCQNLGFVDVII